MYHIVPVHIFLIIRILSDLGIFKKLFRIASKAVIRIDHTRRVGFAEPSGMADGKTVPWRSNQLIQII